MYEDEFELTFNLSGEEPQPEQAAQEPPVPPKPKAASPVVDEPTRVMVLEKPQPAPQPEMPEPVQEEPEKTPAPTVQAAANGRCVLISGGDRGIGAAAAFLYIFHLLNGISFSVTHIVPHFHIPAPVRSLSLFPICLLGYHTPLYLSRQKSLIFA